MNLKNKVEHCLTIYPETRNSDILLTRAIWATFHKEKIFIDNGKPSVHLEDMSILPREDNVKRYRAKIQNDEHRLLPTDIKIIINRKINEEIWYKEMQNINPALG